MNPENSLHYRVISLWQPWASLLAHGIKMNETRPGETRWKGIYLIHAAKRWESDQIAICFTDPFDKLLASIRYNNINDLPRGYIIGSFEVDKCIKITDSYKNLSSTDEDLLMNVNLVYNFHISDQEFKLGNYSAGRYVWFGKNHRLLKSLIPYKGGQGYYQKYYGDEKLLKFV